MDSNDAKNKNVHLGSFSIEYETMMISSSDRPDMVNLSIVRPIGTIDLMTSSEFQSNVMSLIDRGERMFIIDLTKLDFIDSMGLSTIIMLYQKVRDLGGKISILNPKPSIMVVLKVTKLNQRINIFQTLEEALKSY